jgi:integration host factor subunit alpha
MTKAGLVKKIHAATGANYQESAELLETVLSIMKNTLESGENLKISGFGRFEVKRKANRRGRNPHTGETLTIAARRVVTFKSSNVLRDAINGGVRG